VTPFVLITTRTDGTTSQKALIGRSVKLLLALASIVNPAFRTHDHIFVVSKTFTYFDMRPPLRREGLSLPLYRGDFYMFSSYLTGKSLRLRYKAQPVNAV
jgi:hypothetical protein